VPPPDVVVLDLMLPEVSGLDVCRVLRAESDAGVIMLTAKVGEDDKVEGFEFSADDYVTKPFSMKELLARVEAVLRRVGSGKASPGLPYSKTHTSAPSRLSRAAYPQFGDMSLLRDSRTAEKESTIRIEKTTPCAREERHTHPQDCRPLGTAKLHFGFQ